MMSPNAFPAMEGKALWHLVIIFLAQHWLLSVANAGLTLLLGLGFLRLMPRTKAAFAGGKKAGGPAFFQDMDLRLPRCLFLVALCKGAFFLVLGDGHRQVHHTIGYGLQLPDPAELLRLVPQTPHTIWRPTVATEEVAFLLGAVALYLLFRRGRQVSVLMSSLDALADVAARGAQDGTAADEGQGARVQAALVRESAALGFPPGAGLPRLLLAEVAVATPLLVGLRQPYLLLTPSLAAALTDPELDALLRHELAHYRRRDHWWRWALLWVQDIARINPLSGWLSDRVMVLEEDICDRWAARRSGEAEALARAILKSRTHRKVPPHQPDRPRWELKPASRAANLDLVLPHLLGHAQYDQGAGLERRVQILQTYAEKEKFCPAAPASFSPGKLLRAALQGIWTAVLLVFILAVFYMKFFVVVKVAP